MKKTYVKPELAYESFVLSQHIALCNYQIQSGDINACPIIEDRVDDGVDATGGFAHTPVCNFEFEIYCYTNGSVSYNIFQS